MCAKQNTEILFYCFFVRRISVSNRTRNMQFAPDGWEAKAFSAKLDNILIEASQLFKFADIQAIDDILLNSSKKTKVETERVGHSGERKHQTTSEQCNNQSCL